MLVELLTEALYPFAWDLFFPSERNISSGQFLPSLVMFLIVNKDLLMVDLRICTGSKQVWPDVFPVGEHSLRMCRTSLEARHSIVPYNLILFVLLTVYIHIRWC
jgi:hypothetical protein